MSDTFVAAAVFGASPSSCHFAPLWFSKRHHFHAGLCRFVISRVLTADKLRRSLKEPERKGQSGELMVR